MTREEAKKAAEVMLAYAEGKEIEVWNRKIGWKECNGPYFSWCDRSNTYRIKPEPTYRPFKDAEECWEEMQKHQPFGWVKFTRTGSIHCIGYLWDTTIFLGDSRMDFECLERSYTFADGEPFGVKEETV